MPSPSMRHPSRRQVVTAALAVAAAPFAATRGTAQTAAPPPSAGGLLRLVLPFPAGGPTDALVRIVADELKDDLGHAVIVENKPGASGTIGTRHVLNGPPDGAMLLIGNIQTQATAPFLIKDAGYDPRTDFQTVCGLVDVHHVLIVRKDLGLADVAALVARAKLEPGRLNFGSTGIGSGSHLSMELFMARTGTRMQHVPFQGAAQMAGEIAAGRLDLALAVLPTVMGPIEAGSVAALAVAGRERAGQLPKVATFAEAGVANCEAESWVAVFAHARAPAARIDDLGARIRRRIAKPDIKARIEKLGLTVNGRDVAALRAFQAAEIARWSDVIKTAGLKAE